MERLTTRRKDGRWAIKNDDNATPVKQMEKIPRVIDRLAAYEDTGLEPEEVTAIKNAIMGQEISKIIEFDGIPIRRLKELAQAKKDGRLVVLPDVQERDRKSFVDWLQDYFQEASFYDPSTGIFGMSEGEKDLASALMNALTREEAEAAMKKREADL